MKKHKYLLSDLLRGDVDMAKKAVKRGLAVVILVDGGLGMGKTSTAVAIAKHIQPTFNVEKQVGRGVAQFEDAWNHTEKLRIGQGVKACIFDEAQDVDRAGHASKRNKAMRMFMDTFRDARTVLIMCLPHFSRLESNIYLNRSVRFLVHIDDRRNTLVKGRVYEPENIFKMLDFMHRNRNEPMKARMGCYKDVWMNYYFHVFKGEDDAQGVIDHESRKGKRAIRKKSLSSASEE